ncbi:MAG: DEAD/DEAH box helicase family protein [Promethearchaeota archaeon]|nr:MAG: DEAD/DEAH box helicase family protein [Candidatus Lokiarchaeota archaeon]
MIFVSINKNFISHPLIKENSIARREYQENIFINCLNNNCLVVIPTGLGKTIIALMLAVHRLTEVPNLKVLFLAPTKPLVEQHYKSFLDLTTLPPESLISLTGAVAPEKRKELWASIKIAFMTPQVLQNDLISSFYSLDNVSLIIFDECHRAVGDYAYCFIAKKYIDMSNSPQILGLTASPGSTVGKINEIKQNLFIEHIEIRTEKDSDVKPYIHNVDNEWIKIKLPSEFLEIKKILEEKLRNCYRSLKENDLLGSYDILKITRKDLLKLNNLINRRISTARDNDEKFRMFNAKKLTANAIRLSHMTELIETQGLSALKDYFEKNEEKIKINKANKSLKELFADYDFKRARKLTYELYSKGLVHPKIERLKEILTNQINENPHSRILVFCHFRDSVNNIVKYFDENNIIKIHKFVGQAARGSEKGLTQKEQIKLLSEFKDGIYNTLVGTSVAEEGLDIEECDLVVFYDVVPSAIRSIQRRGRTGRKREGKVFVLMAEGTRDEGYYWAEKAKEKNMKSSLEKIKSSEVQTNLGQSNLLNFITSEKNEDNESIDEISSDLSSIKKIEDADKLEIICDNRETASPVVRTLSLMGINLKLEQLQVADYVISERVGIERKSAKDFNDSIIDGRLFTELSGLGAKFSRPVLILEGDPFQASNVSENALYGAITSIILNLGISIYKTKNPSETAQFLYQLAKKEQSTTKSSLKLRFDKAPIETSHLLEYVVAGIPGVNALRAKNLLKELKTLQNIFLADIPDLTKIENIGKKIAQEIYKISRYEYKNNH